jgi:hypothetical protein
MVKHCQPVATQQLLQLQQLWVPLATKSMYVC